MDNETCIDFTGNSPLRFQAQTSKKPGKCSRNGGLQSFFKAPSQPHTRLTYGITMNPAAAPSTQSLVSKPKHPFGPISESVKAWYCCLSGALLDKKLGHLHAPLDGLDSYLGMSRCMPLLMDNSHDLQSYVSTNLPGCIQTQG